MPTALDELTESTAAVAERVAPATVMIGRSGRGSGVVIAPDRVLTNAHNLRDRTTAVTFGDGRVEQAAVVGADAASDLVVLDVPTNDVVPLEWAERAPGVGAAVVAVARSRRGSRTTIGFVSAADRAFRGPRGRTISGGLEHTVPLARGSSGGPLTDLSGGLVGLNTHRLGEGFYLARAVDADLVARVSDLAAGRTPARAELGIAVAPADVAARLRRSVGLDERDGVLVRGVADGSPAATADLREGDLVVAAGGSTIGSVDDLHGVLDRTDPGAPLRLDVVRGADELTLEVHFGVPEDDGS